MIDPHTGEVVGQVPKGNLTPQAQPSPFSCLPTAFAVVMGIDAADLVRRIGHDDLRGFHAQECLGIALAHGWAFTPFEFNPGVESPDCDACGGRGKVPRQVDIYGGAIDEECPECEGAGTWRLEPSVTPVAQLMAQHDGVLAGKLRGDIGFHAVAWDSKLEACLDPRGIIIGLESFVPDTFWLATRRVT